MGVLPRPIIKIAHLAAMGAAMGSPRDRDHSCSATIGSAAAARRSGGTFLRFIDAQGAATHLVAIERFDGRFRCLGGHVHETKASRSACLPIIDELDRVHLSVTFKEHSDIRFVGGKGKIPYINRRHSTVSLSSQTTFGPHFF